MFRAFCTFSLILITTPPGSSYFTVKILRLSNSQLFSQKWSHDLNSYFSKKAVLFLPTMLGHAGLCVSAEKGFFICRAHLPLFTTGPQRFFQINAFWEPILGRAISSGRALTVVVQRGSLLSVSEDAWPPMENHSFIHLHLFTCLAKKHIPVKKPNAEFAWVEGRSEFFKVLKRGFLRDYAHKGKLSYSA